MKNRDFRLVITIHHGPWYVTLSYIKCTLGVSPSLVSRYCEGYSFWSIETANRADSGQLQFWSEPSEILKLRSSNTQKTVAFTIP